MKPTIFEYEQMSARQDAKIEAIFANLNKIISKEQSEAFVNSLAPLNQIPILAMILCTTSSFSYFNYLIANLDEMGAVLSEEAVVTLQHLAELQRYLSGAIELMLVEEPIH